ncbi:nickel-responsive transcriptional regulator NikR [Phytohalomonas tamaricis]|uniref:nickel-responsive transcriptional regulator NikR n=1 Tax=Phytohalomonas tamaricis TaxID=2081032 RepID=UPI000D0AD081|nr:nickel-responsive transcriptional regulator NikR [Phytohalomonas tamaricis]
MQRVTITLDDDLMKAIDERVATHGYQGRSEAIRDLARAGLLESKREREMSGSCIATLVYVYDHAARELTRRLANIFHDHHELSHTTLHVHLDHDSCMEISVLKGDVQSVRGLTERVIAERGVRHGKVFMVPTETRVETHSHGEHGHHGHAVPHEHLHVKSGG